MKRSGFTMIELVFVIVILGILASVAIPKLAATRDDANIAKASTELSAVVSDLGSYYTAHGAFDANVSKMTNVKLYNSIDDGTETDASSVTFTDGSAIHYSDKTRHQHCIDITSVDANGTITLSASSGANTSVYCKGLNKSVASLLKTHTFGGSSIYGD